LGGVRWEESVRSRVVVEVLTVWYD
jgi:hypothetical protein